MRAPRKNDTYVIDMGIDEPSMESTCLLSKALESDSLLWHRRMAHLHYRKMNYITKNGLVLGVPLNRFETEDKCVPSKKGKQHKKAHKAKSQNPSVLHLSFFTWICLVP